MQSTEGGWPTELQDLGYLERSPDPNDRELAGTDRFDVMCQIMQALLGRLTGH